MELVRSEARRLSSNLICGDPTSLPLLPPLPPPPSPPPPSFVTMDLSTKISTCTISTLPSTEEPTFQPTQDEGVLHDILSELDKERTLRAELEQTVRNLTSNSALPDEGEERAKVELSFLLSSLNVDTTASPSSPSSAPASAISPTAEATSSATISSLHDENATLHSKVSSLQSLLSQLTSSSDAIKLAREDGEASLGVPVITVLETAPWKGVEYIQGLEECYEWEVRDTPMEVELKA